MVPDSPKSNATSLGASSGTLRVTDSRTNRSYDIEIRNNAVKATDFRRITADRAAANAVDHVDSGLRILDKGYQNTACVESSVTFVDGQRGYIQYRDASIDDLFRNNDFEEVMHLLIWGHLPSPDEKIKLRRDLAAAMVAPQSVVDAIQTFPRDSLSFPMLLAGLSAFAVLDKGTKQTHQSGRPVYLGNTAAIDEAIVRTLASMATTVALVRCHKRGHAFTPADPNGTFIGNVLLMLGFTQNGRPDPEIEKSFEKMWILTADHEMTNSTAAFLHAASTLTDPISCLIAGMVSAFGPLHGGAIGLAYKGFEELGTPERVPELIAAVKAGKQRLFGYGHRIYRTVDPRTKYVHEMMERNRARMEKNPLLRVALEIDRIAAMDPYFTSRNLKANADLYVCLLYTAFGIETDIIITVAAISRATGMLAHWREAMHEPPLLWRPTQIFTGARL